MKATPVAFNAKLVAELRAAEIAYRQDPDAEDDISMIRDAIAEIERLGRAISDGVSVEEIARLYDNDARLNYVMKRLFDISPPTPGGGAKSCEEIADRALAAFRAESSYAMGLAKLLRLARCPNENCDGEGSVAVFDDGGTLVYQRCQFCDERKAALAKNPNPSGALPTEASGAPSGTTRKTEASGPVGLGPDVPLTVTLPRVALEHIQWAAGGDCPWCGAWGPNQQHQGMLGSSQHTPTCEIGKALAASSRTVQQQGGES